MRRKLDKKVRKLKDKQDRREDLVYIFIKLIIITTLVFSVLLLVMEFITWLE